MVQMEELSLLVKRLEVVTEKLEAVGDAAGASRFVSGSSSPEKLSLSVTAFDDILSGIFRAFLEFSEKIGNEVATAAPMVEKAFRQQRELLRVASLAKQPSQQDLQTLLKPLSETIEEIQTFREQGRRCDYFNHLSALSESIPALGWVTVSPAPGPFILEMNHAGQFYTNRVLKDWKEKSAIHVEWVKAWGQVLTELQAYAKQFHTTGLLWNKTTSAAEPWAIFNKAESGVAVAPPPPPGPPGPPPPPPPPPATDLTVGSEATEKGGRDALLDSINKGGEITAGLRKVTDEEKTHKNPALKSDGKVEVSKKPHQTNGVTTAVSQQPAKTELDGKKWMVEFHKNNKTIVIAKTEPNQSVYVYKCEGCTIQVEGKVSNIILDSCKKTGVLFESVVAGIEFINCQSMQMQVTGCVPTISVDKTDGCQMFLSKDSLGVDIITAKSSEMNVMIPTEEEFLEQPLPEQFRTKVEGTKLSTVPMDHSDFLEPNQA